MSEGKFGVDDEDFVCGMLCLLFIKYLTRGFKHKIALITDSATFDEDFHRVPLFVGCA